MQHRPAYHRTQPRTGFTLVELLVTVALVLLMMTLFTEIFVIATGAMSTQRGLAENDQSARRVHSTITKDLRLMTYQARTSVELGFDELGIVPLNFDSEDPPTVRRRGYFYYSENTPGDQTDDVLQFTITKEVVGDENENDKIPTPFFGRATLATQNVIQPNQPEADDGDLFLNPGGDWQVTNNSRGASKFAEVVYWLRHGILYRRLLLIREENTDTKPPDAPPPDPPSGLGLTVGGDYQSPDPDAPQNPFWRDFDYSAYYLPDPDPAISTLKFHEQQQALDNSLPTVSLGIPKYRFGFGGIGQDGPGFPFEFVGANFIGRFTHEETSDPAFRYPGRLDGNGNTPMNNGELVYNSEAGVVDDYRFDETDDDDIIGSRRGQDILLTDVVAFDVKLFDEQTRDFEDLGHSNPIGDYHSNNNQLTSYGNSYDTWHTSAGPDEMDNQSAPFRPVRMVNGSSQPIPLRAIQITIRYLDRRSNQMRDLTIVHSFAEE